MTVAAETATSSKTTNEKDNQSEEEKRLQEELTLLVEKILGDEKPLYLPALESLRDLIRTSTTSMTSVPMPLKFLHDYYDKLKEACEKMEGNARDLCCSIVSVLAMGQAPTGKLDCLKYCLRGNQKDVGDWGHEYVRQLEGEIAEEWNNVEADKNQLLVLIKSIVDFDMRHNAEIQACDLLMEIDQLELLHMDQSNYLRVCLYLVSCAFYVEEPERGIVLAGVMKHYLHFKEYPRALALAMLLNDTEKMIEIFNQCSDPTVRKQLAFIAGRQHISLELSDDLTDKADKVDLVQIMCNSHINDHFHSLARELDILEPKTPDEVYKTWLEGLVLRPSFNLDVPVDSAKHNLASTFVNAFVNAGFSRDKLVTVEDGNKWMYKNKQHGMLSAAASLGLIHLWDVDGGLTPIDKFLYTNEDFIKAGALLALGIVNVGVRNDCDPAFALLSDYVLHESITLRIGSVLGLGLAYAGTQHTDVTSLLLPVMSDKKSTHEVVALAAISCGMINVGSGNHKVVSSILQTLFDLSPSELNEGTFSRFLPLAVGLCYLGKKDATDATSAALEVLPEPFRSFAKITLEMCAYAGSGDVLVIQELLHTCSESQSYAKEDTNKKEEGKKDKESDKKDDKRDKKESVSKQAIAALAVAVIAIGEETGSEMCTRIFGQLGRYAENPVRRTVPLAVALLSISNPQLNVIDVLNKYSHDLDEEVAINAIFSMGLVGAGTNNARLATMLRQLAQYHAKNSVHLFMVRIAQGLTHMGKGTMTLSPFHTDRQIMNPIAISGLLVTLFCFLDTKNIILGKSHYLLYTLATAMYPRWLVTLDEDLEPLPVTVRVGQAVDVIGKAGTPKTIAGVHTHTTPVLLAVGERAELATDDYTPLTPVMEGFVILRKKNPEENQ